MSNKYNLFNSVIAASIMQWVDSHRKNDDGEVPEILSRVRTKCYYHRALNAFSDEEIDLLMKIDKDPEFIKIKEVEISYLVQSLAVLKIWVEDVPKNLRPNFNISDKKMVVGSGHYWKHLLTAKQFDPELYKIEKKLIEDTNEHAQKWYAFFRSKLINT